MKLIVELTEDQAKAFVDDWASDPAAPVLTGGSQENSVYPVSVASGEDVGREAAPYHGLALNRAYSVQERLQLALKALDIYEKALT